MVWFSSLISSKSCGGIFTGVGNGVLIQFWFSIPGVWSKATASKPYAQGRYPGGTDFSPAPDRKIFPGVTKGTQRNDRNPCPQAGWKIQETNGTSSPEPESPRSSEKSSKLFRYEGGRGEERLLCKS